ncbi:hypothetical protein lerEdw1_011624 [Lerista edwardsae]|nr:hypothetical protein lerEdw1_011624 [Lerista edwardsae]
MGIMILASSARLFYPQDQCYERLFPVLFNFSGIWCKEEKITQDSHVEAFVGKELNLSCSHPSATTENVFWYQQLPNQSPRFLVYTYTVSKEMEDPKGALIVAEDRKSSILSISRVALEDAAVYLCALSDTVLHSGAPAVQEAFLPWLAFRWPQRWRKQL